MPITQETMSQELSQDPAEIHALKTQMNPFLYYTLMSLVGGSAYTILEQVEEENGCEAYRRLYLRYARTKMQNAIMRIATIVNMKFHDSNFETTFTEWESEMHKIEVSLNNKIDDVIKVGILIAGTTGKLHDHLCLTLGDTLSYDDTRDMVINYLKTKSLTSQTRKGPDDMDVSAITKGKGFGSKGKGKGKGSGTTSPNKGKGKGKDKGQAEAKGTSKGGKSKGRWCHNCKSNTHDTKYCYRGGAKGQRKGVRGLFEEEGAQTQSTMLPLTNAVARSTMSQLETQSTAPPSTVAAIHYGQVVGEAWDNDNYSKTMQINMVAKEQKM